MKDFERRRFEQRMANDPRFTVEYQVLERRFGPKLRTLSLRYKRLVYTELVKRYDSMLQQLNAIAGGGGYGGSGASSPPHQPAPWPTADLSPDSKETWDAVKPNEDTDDE